MIFPLSFVRFLLRLFSFCEMRSLVLLAFLCLLLAHAHGQQYEIVRTYSLPDCIGKPNISSVVIAADCLEKVCSESESEPGFYVEVSCNNATTTEDIFDVTMFANNTCNGPSSKRRVQGCFPWAKCLSFPDLGPFLRFLPIDLSLVVLSGFNDSNCSFPDRFHIWQTSECWNSGDRSFKVKWESGAELPNFDEGSLIRILLGSVSAMLVMALFVAGFACCYNKSRILQQRGGEDGQGGAGNGEVRAENGQGGAKNGEARTPLMLEFFRNRFQAIKTCIILFTVFGIIFIFEWLCTSRNQYDLYSDLECQVESKILSKEPLGFVTLMRSCNAIHPNQLYVGGLFGNEIITFDLLPGNESSSVLALKYHHPFGDYAAILKVGMALLSASSTVYCFQLILHPFGLFRDICLPMKMTKICHWFLIYIGVLTNLFPLGIYVTSIFFLFSKPTSDCTVFVREYSPDFSPVEMIFAISCFLIAGVYITTYCTLDSYERTTQKLSLKEWLIFFDLVLQWGNLSVGYRISAKFYAVNDQEGWFMPFWTYVTTQLWTYVTTQLRNARTYVTTQLCTDRNRKPEETEMLAAERAETGDLEA